MGPPQIAARRDASRSPERLDRDRQAAPQVFERLRAGPHAVNAIAAGMPVSRPAVSQHLKVLKDAGLVEERSEGVRRIYSVRREGLGTAVATVAWGDGTHDTARLDPPR